MISLRSANTPAISQTDALKTVEAARSDPKHTLWDLSPEEQRKYYLAAFPGPRPAPGGAAEPAGAPPAPVTPAAPPPDSLEAVERDTAELVIRAKRQPAPLSEAEALRLVERRRVLLGAQNTAIFTQDDHGNVREAPDPGEQAPVVPTPETLPALTLPSDIPLDTPVVDAARTLAFYAETSPALLQRAVDAVRGALEREEPSQEALDAEGVRVTARAQAYYGANFPAWQAALQEGRAIAERDPELRELLEDSRLWNLPAVAEFLVSLGRDPRRYYVRRFGTKPVARIP